MKSVRGNTHTELETSGKIVALRLFRLGHLPTALYGSEILKEHGFEILIIEFGNAIEKQLQVLSPLPRVRFHSPWVKWLPQRLRPVSIFISALIQLLLKIRREGHPRLIIAHGLHEEVMAYWLWKIFRIPYVVHVHEIYEPSELSPLNRFLVALEGKSLREAQFLIFPEENRAELYRSRYALKCLIHIGFNCPRKRTSRYRGELRKRLGLPLDSRLILYVGGIGINNGLEEGISALRGLANAYFLLLGWGESSYLSRLQQMATELGVRERVLFLGEVEDKWEYLEGSDLGYCLYRDNSLRLKFIATASNKLMEALSAGLPVLTTNQPGFRQIIEEHQVGVGIDEISPKEITEAIRNLFGDPVRMKEMSSNGIRLHQELFNYEIQFAPILKSFQHLLGKIETVNPKISIGAH